MSKELTARLRVFGNMGPKPSLQISHEAADTIERLEAERDTAWAQAHRLALELECLLMDTKDNAVVSKWWDSANEALDQWREFCSEIEADNVEKNPQRGGSVMDSIEKWEAQSAECEQLRKQLAECQAVLKLKDEYLQKIRDVRVIPAAIYGMAHTALAIQSLNRLDNQTQTTLEKCWVTCGRCGKRFGPGDSGIHTCSPTPWAGNMERKLNDLMEEVRNLRAKDVKPQREEGSD